MNGRRIPIIKTVYRNGRPYQQTFWVSDEELSPSNASGSTLGKAMNGTTDSGVLGRAAQMGKKIITDLYGTVSKKARITHEKLTHAGLHADEVTVIQHEMGENYIIAKKITSITAAPFLKAGALGLRSMQRIADLYSEANGDSGYKISIDVDGGRISFSVRKEASDDDVSDNLTGVVNGDDCGGPSVSRFIRDVRKGKVLHQYQAAVDHILCSTYNVSVSYRPEKEMDGFGKPMIWDRRTSTWSVGTYSSLSSESEAGIAFSYAINPKGRSVHRISPIYTPNDRSLSSWHVQAAKDNIEAMRSYWEAVDRAASDPRSMAESFREY